MREKHQLFYASHTCLDWGSNPQPRYVSQQAIEPETFWCTGQRSNELSHPARAEYDLKVILCPQAHLVIQVDDIRDARTFAFRAWMRFQ